MRCTAYCTAASYPVPLLLQFLENRIKPTLYRDVIHSSHTQAEEVFGDVFYFPYGVIVCWGLTEESERQVLAEVSRFEQEPLPKAEFDNFTFSYGSPSKIYQDEIILQTPSVMTKLAVSYGLAQSVKLTVFENAIRKTIENTKQLPQELVKKGKIPLSRKEISRKIGELFLERNSINLHTDILDTPEFFWEYSELEPFYRSTANYLDISTRVDVLNKRLNIVRELLEMLGNELNHQHSSALEWTIIWLIVIEVVIATLKDIFHFI
ncbi:MAG: RMD1 family protein [Parachlamydiales bacterium]|nr:RMD1 family protein [Parachlamydiales bacterium]